MKGSHTSNSTPITPIIIYTHPHPNSLHRYMVRMDEKGDAEGNYTLIGRQKHHITPGEYGLYPVGGFRYSVGDYKRLPVSFVYA